jgi:hypothetical protein
VTQAATLDVDLVVSGLFRQMLDSLDFNFGVLVPVVWAHSVVELVCQGVAALMHPLLFLPHLDVNINCVLGVLIVVSIVAPRVLLVLIQVVHLMSQDTDYAISAPMEAKATHLI